MTTDEQPPKVPTPAPLAGMSVREHDFRPADIGLAYGALDCLVGKLALTDFFALQRCIAELERRLADRPVPSGKDSNDRIARCDTCGKMIGPAKCD